MYTYNIKHPEPQGIGVVKVLRARTFRYFTGVGIPPLDCAVFVLHDVQKLLDAVPLDADELSFVARIEPEQVRVLRDGGVSLNCVGHVEREGLVDVSIGDFLPDTFHDRDLFELLEFAQRLAAETAFGGIRDVVVDGGEYTQLHSVIVDDDEVKFGRLRLVGPNARNEDE